MAPIFFPTIEIIRFVIVLTRLLGIMLLAPFFGNQSFPIQVRIIFSLVCALVLAPSLPLKQVPVELDLSSVLVLMVGEVMIGLILGFAASCVFAGLQFAGQIISFQLGFSIVNLIDPQSEVEAPIFSFLQNYIGMLFFLIINGHHWFLTAIRDSFSFLPIGGISIRGPLMEHLVHLSAQVLIIGVRVAGPVIAVCVITDLVLGVISRAAPSIHIWIVGMPLKLLVGFSCLSLSFYFLPRFFGEVFSALSNTIFSFVHGI